MSTTKDPKTSDERKAYAPPVLVKFGDATQLIQGTGGSNTVDADAADCYNI